MTYVIRDTGIGMSPEFLPHIFDEFAQEEHGARTQYKGTGLGMAITKRYVEMMGGTISVESERGEGSAFTVEIPLALTDAPAEACKDEGDAARCAGLKVLLAEDNDMNAEIATIQLTDAGMRVTRVADGAEAVEAFRTSAPGTFDLVLMDIMMPNLNGYEATVTIRETEGRPDAKTLPVIAMTANAFAEDVQAARDAGMDAHIAKPIVTEEMFRTIAACLKSRG